MGFLPLAILVWLVAVAAWYFISKYYKSSDADKIKQRLTGIGKARQKTKETKGGEQSIIQTQQGGNKFAQVLVEKYQLGPKMQLLLEQAGLRWTPARLVHLSIMAFGAGFIIGWVALPIPMALDLLVGLAVAPLPFVYVFYQRKGRLKKFEAIFPETLEFISRSMRAGHAFSVSLEMIYREFAEPVSGEFRRTFEEHNLGLPIEVALQGLAKRVPSLDVHFFVSAVLLQKRTGGNLAEILDKLAYVIRERFKLRGRIRAVSAHGKMTATSLSCIPIAVAVLMFYTNPDYVKFFFTDDVGNIMLAVGVALQIFGYLVMKKIVNIEV
ncbi:MAG TPA: type II secretion system F family protein [Bryobacteraceae bacterium]|jgi:tight adherence protein B|nr:type II secretion system F family protein [Bryobacteraceae bacterium]